MKAASGKPSRLSLPQKPRGYVAILSHLQRLVKLDLDRRTAHVESATPLSPEQQDATRTSLARKYGPGSANFILPGPSADRRAADPGGQ